MSTVLSQLQPQSRHEADVQRLTTFVTQQLMGVDPTLIDELTNTFTQVTRHFRKETQRIHLEREQKALLLAHHQTNATPQRHLQPTVPITRPPRSVTPQPGASTRHDSGYHLTGARAQHIPQDESEWATPTPMHDRPVAVTGTLGYTPIFGNILGLHTPSPMSFEATSPATARLLESVLNTPTRD